MEKSVFGFIFLENKVGTVRKEKDIGKTTYSIDKTQYKDYTKDSEADVGGTTVGFAGISLKNRCKKFLTLTWRDQVGEHCV